MGFLELLKANREREILLILQINQGRQEVRPGPDERKKRDGREGGHGQRKDDAPINPPLAAAVNAGGLHQRGRNSHEKLPQKKNKKGRTEKRRKDQRPEGVHEAQASKDQKHRNHRYLRREEHGGQEDLERHFASAPLQDGEAVGHERGREHIPGDAPAANQKRVGQVAPERNQPRGFGVVAPQKRPGDPRWRELKDLRSGFERAAQHPEKRHGEAEGKRQEKPVKEQARPGERPARRGGCRAGWDGTSGIERRIHCRRIMVLTFYPALAGRPLF